MAGKGFIADFLVRITSTGLGRAKKDVDDLGHSTENLGVAHRRAAIAAADHFNTTEKGVIGTANATKNFSKLAQGMNSSSGIVGAYATLAANIFAVTAAFNALRGAAQVQQVQQGLEAMGARMGLTLSNAAQSVKEISGYTLSAEQSMRSTAQVMSAGLGTKTLERITAVSKDASFALGRNMTDSMDRLTKGAVKLEPELLDELGLMTKLTEATNLYANAHHKSATSLTNFEKRQAFANAVLAEGEAKFGGISKAAGDSRAYDQLAATFADLSYQGLTVINKVLLPLANIFGSKGVLLAGMILFASTIRKQLLPGLGSAAENAKKTSEAIKELAVTEAKAISKSGEFPNAAMNRAIKRIEKGKDATKQIAKARSVYQQDLIAANDILAMPDVNASGRDLYTSEKIKAQQGLAALNELEAAQHRVAKAEAESQAVNAAATRQYKLAYKEARIAIAEYNAELASSSAAAGKSGSAITKMFTSVRTGAYATALSLKLIGTALLEAIPIIGQVILVVSLLWAGWQKLKEWYEGKAIVEYNKALDDQVDTLNNVSKTVDNANRVARSDISIRLKEQQIWQSLGNSVRENIDSYNTVADARNKAFSNDTTFKLEDTPEYRTLNVLTHAYPQALKQIQAGLAKRGVDKNILEKPKNMLTVSELKAIGDVINNDLNKGLPQLGDAITALGQAYDATSKAVNDFNLAAVPSTPYDQVVKNFNNITDSMYEAAQAASSIGDLQARTAAGLASAPQELRNFLGVDTQKAIKEYETLEQKIRETQRAGKEVSQQDSTRYGQLEKILSLHSYELISVQKQFAAAQAITRETQGLVQIEQARLQKLNSYTALSAKDVIRRREAENRILQLQISQLQTQKTIIDSQIRMQKIQSEIARQDLIYQEAKLGLLKDQNFLNDEQVYKTTLQHLNELQGQIDSGKGNTVALQAQADEWRKLLGLVKDYATARNVITDNEAAAAQLNKQIAAQQISMTSKASMAAEGAATAAQTAADNRDKENQVITQSITLRDTLLNIQAKEQGRVRSVAEEYNQLITNQTLATKSAKEQATAQTSAAIAQLKYQRQQASEQGAKETVAILDQRIQREQDLLTIQLNQIDANNRLAILEKYSFDTQSDGIKMQQDSLQYVQKYLDTMKDVVSAQREGADLDRQLARRRAGIADNRYTEAADEIRTAREKYQEALREAEVRKATITLEFALIDAQRQQTIFNLEAQRQIVGVSTEMGQQLAATINNMQSAAKLVDTARQAALDAVDQTTLNAKKNYQLAITPDRRRDTIGGILQSRREYEAERMKGLKYGAFERAPVQDTHISPLIKSQDDLKVSVDNLNSSINKALVDKAGSTPAASGAIAGSGAGSDIAKFFMQRLGLTAQQAAGIAGNLKVESGFDPRAYNAKENAQGIAQWRGDRLANFKKTMGVDALSATLQQQLEFVAKELEGRFANVLKELRTKSTATGAAGLIDSKYEISSGDARGKRGAAAEALVGSIDQSKLTTAAEKIAVNTQVVSDAVQNPKPTAMSTAPSDVITIMGTLPQMIPQVDKIGNAIEDLNSITTTGPMGILNVFQEMADKLGPQGSIMPAIIEGLNTFGDNYKHFIDVIQHPTGNKGQDIANTIEAAGSAVSGVLSTIASVSASASQVRVAGIDAEIAAEQKRDGKSSESLAKIQALENKKDALQRKQFNTQKKIMMAQAIIATATGVAQALASSPPPLNFIMAGIVGAMGAAQLAIIAGTSYQSTSSPNTTVATPPDQLNIGSRNDQVNLAKNNPNAGGEIGYLRGTAGYGKNSSDYKVIGSAYGGNVPRGYGNTGFLVGEHGPEVIDPIMPMTVRPASDSKQSAQLGPVHIEVKALDARGVHEMLLGQRGNIIGMLREAANANGQPFLEDVNTNVYTRPEISKL